jgi:hypothetical protein
MSFTKGGELMSVPRYTTPVFTLTFSEEHLDLTEATDVFVTFKQACNLITKTGEDLTVEKKSIAVSFSQEETAQFCIGEVEIQANWMIAGKRAASEIVKYQFTDNLLKQVIQ